jgi:hypothetical protein
MLFDLRGRGRRRTIQGIYLGLAVLMGGGLIFFGVGGSGVGLFNSDNSSSGGGSALAQLKKDSKKAQAAVTARPKDPAAWAKLAGARYAEAGQGENFDVDKQSYNDKGRGVLRQSVAAWDKYLALNPKKPDEALATQIAKATGGERNALFDPSTASAALEVVTQVDPTANGYYIFMYYAYLAKETRKGDLAAAKALELTPKAQRTVIKQQIDQGKAQALQGKLPDGSTPQQAVAGQ